MGIKEEFKRVRQKKYDLYKEYRKEVIKNHERERSAQRARMDLMIQLERMTELRDQLQEDFDNLLELVDKPEKGY